MGIMCPKQNQGQIERVTEQPGCDQIDGGSNRRHLTGKAKLGVKRPRRSISGISRQDNNLRGVRRRIYIHCGRTGVFPGEGFWQRTQALS